MQTEWRLLYDGIHEARHHFAVEEALARLLDDGQTPPTLRMRQVNPAVFVGVYQNPWTDVNVDYCQANNIQIVRRMNGGGAVYHEMGSFCFSAFFRRDWFSQSEEELYRIFATPAILTCADYGVDAHFQGRNDVLVGERKIYGSAQLAWYNAFVQSGTFLVNIDIEIMVNALTPPAIKFEKKPAQSIRERVTTLSKEVGRELETREVMNRFSRHFADALGIKLIPGDLTPEELALASHLLTDKYSTFEWNLGTRPEYQVTVADRTERGVVSLSVDMDGEQIQNIRINGDLLLTDRQALEDLKNNLAYCSLQEALSIVKNVSVPTGMRAVLFRLLAKIADEIEAISS